MASVLSHNLVVLVHELYVSGIVAAYNGMVEEKVGDEPRVIRFPGA